MKNGKSARPVQCYRIIQTAQPSKTRIARRIKSSTWRTSTTTTLVVLAAVMVLAQTGGHAAPKPPPPPLPGDALPYTKGFLVTGDYLVSGIDFTSVNNPADSNGLATGTISISDAATAGGAYLVGAYLYWEAVHPYPVTPAGDPTINVKFRGSLLSSGLIRATTKPIASGGATCWGSAGQGSFAVSMFRASVLSLMPKQFDQQGNWTGKYLVNAADLPSTDPGHTVTLREKTGDSAIQSAGATLLLVYRSLNPAEPLRKIVVYDGLYTAYNGVSSATAEATTMVQKIRGFYKSTGPSARITHLVGVGGNNQTETINVTSNQSTVSIGPPPVSADPFPQTSPSSDRSWVTAHYPLNSFMPGIPGTQNSNDRYGESVTTTVQASSTSPAACRAWAAVIFSTQVADSDDDGLPDGLEDEPGGLRDPDNAELPNLRAMGASSKWLVDPNGSGTFPNVNDPHPDLFVEFNSTWAAEGTKYGSPAAPYPNVAGCHAPYGSYDATNKRCEDLLGHHHFPTPEDLKRIGDRYKAHNITAHFDVGRVTGDPTLYPAAYHNLGIVPHGDWVDDYTSTDADGYLIGVNNPALARGGEVIRETACDANEPECVFPDYPGTVGWKLGLLAHRNAPVNNAGEELNPDLTDPNDNTFDWIAGPDHRLRFDRVRRPFFHYILGAHTTGTPTVLPCLKNGEPTGYSDNGTCGTNQTNPAYQLPQVPRGIGGLGDLPGRNALVTHGLWDEFVGRPYARAVTIFHELGHNLNLWHSGVPADFGDADEDTVIEANGKPNFLSSMNYLFELHGLFDEFGKIQLDYSHSTLTPPLNEDALTDGASLTTPLYRRAWYAPFYLLDQNGDPVEDQNGNPVISPLVSSLGITAPATRFVGAPFGPGQPETEMARVVSNSFSQQSGWHIDWDGDGSPPGSPETVSQDTAFDGSISTALSGYSEWDKIRLDQISANGLTGGTDDYVFLVGSDELTQLVGSDDFPNLIGTDDLPQLIGTDEMVMMIGGDELVMLLGTDDFVTLMGTDDFVTLLGTDELPQLIGSDELPQLIGSDEHSELSYGHTKGLGRMAPYEVTACNIDTPGCSQASTNKPRHRVELNWAASTVGHVLAYHVERKLLSAPDSAYEELGTTANNTFVDNEELPNGVDFIYRLRAEFDDLLPNETGPTVFSGWAHTQPITAVNFAPGVDVNGSPGVNINDSYTTAQNTPLTVPSSGPPPTVVVLANDADVDSPTVVGSQTVFIGRRAVPSIPNPPATGPYTIATSAGGVVVLQNGGGFFYTPPSASFIGTDTFKYKSDDGFWRTTNIPLSGLSHEVTVSISVTKKKNQP